MRSWHTLEDLGIYEANEWLDVPIVGVVCIDRAHAIDDPVSNFTIE